MSLQAYQQAATRAETPRDLEYRLFAQVTRALLEAAERDPKDLGARIDALDWNRRVWSTFAAACADPDNQLPPPLRASIISLSIWVSKHTSLVIRREDEIEPLIDVNKMIMQGLAARGDAQAA
jgi:flagellar biosynthesis activator protein FlaF